MLIKGSLNKAKNGEKYAFLSSLKYALIREVYRYINKLIFFNF